MRRTSVPHPDQLPLLDPDGAPMPSLIVPTPPPRQPAAPLAVVVRTPCAPTCDPPPRARRGQYWECDRCGGWWRCVDNITERDGRITFRADWTPLGSVPRDLPPPSAVARRTVVPVASGWVYIARDVNGRVLYVGKTVRSDPFGRLRDHWRAAPWWAQTARVETRRFDGGPDEVLAAETALIATLDPVHNVHRPPWDGRMPVATARVVYPMGKHGMLVLPTAPPEALLYPPGAPSETA